MIHKIIDLKDFFSEQLSESDATMLHCYLPSNSAEICIEKRPSVIVCPGGGYSFLSDREAEPIALAFLAKGFNAFILRYSLTPKHYPLQVYEATAAMLYIRSHAESLNVAKNQIAVCGFSAGGHVAASLTTLWETESVRQAFGLKASEARPDAAILCYPVISSQEPTHMQSIEGVAGGDKKLKEYLSLEKHVTKNTPPCFLFHTANDECVDVRNSLVMAEALSVHKVPFEAHIYEDGPHGLSLANELVAPVGWSMGNAFRTEGWFELAISWLKARGIHV